MSELRDRLSEHAVDPAGRRWIYVPYDQLTDRVGPLSRAEPGEIGLVFVESTWKAARRPYHQQKLAMVLANQRHFAVEQAARGVAIDYRQTDAPYEQVLAQVVDERGRLTVMEPAERELRAAVRGLVEAGALRVVPHEGWLTTDQDFREGAGEAPYRMDAFYRQVRRRTGLLMRDGSPLGGRYSHDGDNRQSWRGDPVAPAPPTFPVDALTAEVGDLIAQRFAHHPGTLRLDRLPATAAHAETLWAWALGECLRDFGPYEDAMSRHSRGLFHTRIAPLLNLHRLLPARVVRDVADADVPLNSKEGFIRQVLGWREFVRHVHRATDGFRDLPSVPMRPEPGDGGFALWSGEVWSGSAGPDGGAAPSVLGAREPLPPAWWGTRSGLSCLDTVVEELWDEGWTHHIPRLMVLANLATLLDVDPRELTDWFWVAFTDAYDWVVEPNVLSMGTFGTGEIMTTKPYVSGSAYLHRMGDYCKTCAFHPKKTCPVTPLYWAFLARHADQLGVNQRMSLALGGLKRRSPERQAHDARIFALLRERLMAGEPVRPSDLDGL